jgi:hypothetical protein
MRESMKPPHLSPLLVISVIGILCYDSSKMPAGILEHGKEIFDQPCWRCHGRSGNTDAPVSNAMNARTRNFTDRTSM